MQDAKCYHVVRMWIQKRPTIQKEKVEVEKREMVSQLAWGEEGECVSWSSDLLLSGGSR